MGTEKELIPHLFRTEYSKIVAVLGRLFGFEHIEIVEDIVSDTFMLAAESWGQKGLPPKSGCLAIRSREKQGKRLFKAECYL